MKTDFMIALTQLASERNLPRELILKTIEASLVPIFKKNCFTANQEIKVKIIPQTGEVKVYAEKVVVSKKPADPVQEVLQLPMIFHQFSCDIYQSGCLKYQLWHRWPHKDLCLASEHERLLRLRE